MREGGNGGKRERGKDGTNPCQLPSFPPSLLLSQIDALPMRRNSYVRHPLILQDGRHGLERGRLTMHDEGAANRPAETADPGPKLVPICMSGIAADGLDLGAALVLPPQDPDHLLATLDPASQRVLRLEPDEQDQVAVIADSTGQMVEDAARLDHTGGRDDHGGSGLRCQGLGLLDIPYVTEQREIEQLV